MEGGEHASEMKKEKYSSSYPGCIVRGVVGSDGLSCPAFVYIRVPHIQSTRARKSSSAQVMRNISALK